MNLADIPPSTLHRMRKLALREGMLDVATACERLLWAPLAHELREIEPGLWEAVNDYGRPWRFSSPCRGLVLLARLLAGEHVRLNPGEVDSHRMAARRALDALRANGCSRLAAHMTGVVFKRDGRVLLCTP